MSQLRHRQLEIANLLSGSEPIGKANDVSGVNPRRLDLTARLIAHKRQRMICEILPRTWKLLGDSRDDLYSEFRRAVPSARRSRVENGNDFRNFLVDHWLKSPPSPPWLPDVLACEMAIATVMGSGEDADKRKRKAIARPGRHPNSVFLECAFDVRPLFEKIDAGIDCRPVYLAFGLPHPLRPPAICEVPKTFYDWVTESREKGEWENIPDPEIVERMVELAILQSGQ